MTHLFIRYSDNKIIQEKSKSKFNEILFSPTALYDEEYLDMAIKIAIDFMEQVPNVMVIISYEDILTKVVPRLPKIFTLVFANTSLINEKYHLLGDYPIYCLAIHLLYPHVLSELTLVDIKVRNNFEHLDRLRNHENIRCISIESDDRYYKYKSRLNLDRVQISVNAPGTFLSSFFDQCDRIKEISIPSKYVKFIPDRLTDGMKADVTITDEKDLDHVFSRNFTKLYVRSVWFNNAEIYKHVINLVDNSDIPIIIIFSCITIQIKNPTDEATILHNKLAELLEKRLDKLRFAKTKAILPSLSE